MTPPNRSLLVSVLAGCSLLLLGSCGHEPPDEDGPPLPDEEEVPAEGCGDGELGPFEECDEGASNSDSRPDACRTTCVLPSCGDYVVDSGEECDNGAYWGGAGCTSVCTVETSPPEIEPNDSVIGSQQLPEGGSVAGGIFDGDKDCFFFEVAYDGWVSARLGGNGVEECPSGGVIELFDGLGMLRATGTPGEVQGCATIDPMLDDGARFAEAGTWVACVSGLLDALVPSYELSVEVGDDSCSLPGLSLPASEDMDGDGLTDHCDEDDDGDGIDDVDDNCPDVPNGEQAKTTDSSGFIRDWLTVGEFTDNPSPEQCMPSEVELLGDDATAVAMLGEQVGDGPSWMHFKSENPRINFRQEYGGPTPREVYAMVWLRTDLEQSATLSYGADDGVRIWLNGQMVDELASCQGVNNDQFEAPVTLLEGWNRLLFKVRDNGGGWGMSVRLHDASGLPMSGMDVSIYENQLWVDNQTDTDGDGVGDACDSTPTG